MPGLALNWRRTSCDDGAGGAADGRHGDAAEQVGDEAAEQQADDDVGVGEREIGVHALEVGEGGRACGIGLVDEVLQVVAVGRKQHQRAEAGRADGVALGHGLRRVADGIERVGGAAHLLRQARHLGDAAGVVGDRAEGVERDDDAGEAEHGRRGDRGAEQAGERVGRENAADDDERGQRGRLERHGEALDHVGAVARHGSLGDRAHRLIADAGVVLGDPDDEAGHEQADEAAQEQVHAGDRHAGCGSDLAEARRERSASPPKGRRWRARRRR